MEHPGSFGNMVDLYSLNNRVYFESASDYPNDYRGVKWTSAESQFIRFKVLCDIADDIFSSDILDVGCGLGHLVDYLKNNQFTGTYYGIDIVAQMILNAKKRHPAFHFECNDIDSIGENQHEYVLASGIFALTDAKQTKSLIPSLFACAKKGLAFNCLSSLAEEKEEGMHYHIPGDIYHFCKQFTPRVTLRKDYIQHDFTIYMHK